MREPDKWASGKRHNILRHDDDWRTEGDSHSRSKEKWKTGEKYEVNPEGQFEGRRPEEWNPGERAPVMKREDNLKLEGTFQERTDEKWTTG